MRRKHSCKEQKQKGDTPERGKESINFRNRKEASVVPVKGTGGGGCRESQAP